MECMPIILLNNICNFRCYHCYVRHASAELPLEKLQQFYHNLMKPTQAKFLRFAGGEPFMYTRFHELALFLESIQGQGIDMNFTTNGSLVTDAILDDLKRIRPNLVKVSLLSLRPDKYREIVGVDHPLSETLWGVDRLMKHFPVGINMTIMRDTLCDVQPLIDFCLNRGIHDLFFSQLTLAGSGHTIRDKKLTDEEIHEVHRIIGEVDREQLNIRYDDGCQCGFYKDYVLNWDGDVFPCSALVSYPEFKIGTCDSSIEEMRKRIGELCVGKKSICFVDDFVTY